LRHKEQNSIPSAYTTNLTQENNTIVHPVLSTAMDAILLISFVGFLSGWNNIGQEENQESSKKSSRKNGKKFTLHVQKIKYLYCRSRQPLQ